MQEYMFTVLRFIMKINMEFKITFKLYQVMRLIYCLLSWTN